MYEVSCPSCQKATYIYKKDLIHVCQHCHACFRISIDKGLKNLIQDHFYLQHHFDLDQLKEGFLNFVGQSFQPLFKKTVPIEIVKKDRVYLPFWVIRLEVQTQWEGLSQKARAHVGQDKNYSSQYVKESGEFIKTYAWSILARENVKEFWGLDSLNEENLEKVPVRWTGSELNQLIQTKKAWKTLEFSEDQEVFNYQKSVSDSTPILGGQMHEKDAVKLAKAQVKDYHRGIVELKVDRVTNCDTTVEVVGLLLLHVPFVVFYYQSPKSFQSLFQSPKKDEIYQKALLSPITGEVLKIEWPHQVEERLLFNRFLISLTFIVFLFLGVSWTWLCFFPAFGLLVFWFLIEAKMSFLIEKIKKPFRSDWVREGQTKSQTTREEWPL
jgi:hypothetical protein